MFSPTYRDLRGVSDHHAANVIALLQILVEKGVCTEEEFRAHHAKAVSFVDQTQAKSRDEAIKDDPAAAIMAALFGL